MSTPEISQFCQNNTMSSKDAMEPIITAYFQNDSNPGRPAVAEPAIRKLTIV